MRILCPTDGSPGAAAALDAVLGTFAPTELTVDLLTVIPSHDGPSSVAGAAAQVDATALLASERARLDAAGIAVETAALVGHPADEIDGFAATRRPVLVVLGSRAQSGGGQVVTGPVANALARNCSASVLIVRHGRPIRSIVLGYDGSRGAEAALSLLTQLPWRAPPRIHVGVAFDVVHPFASGIAPLLRDQVLEATDADLIRSGEMAQATASGGIGAAPRGRVSDDGPCTPWSSKRAAHRAGRRDWRGHDRSRRARPLGRRAIATREHQRRAGSPGFDESAGRAD